MAVSFVNHHLNIFGITDVTTFVIEGHNQFPDQAETIIEKSIHQAVQAAKIF
ncbi:hypothetical protein [Paenibacillus sp. LHD-38]|uniref:hypothetical protein n=1 Tax=Paenibacillus sp. LHD-38 TaxID=3072143 RepID=UPI002810597D|nr:hypothetical protein [Paenibacillus sp. LHD-38]MDQ8737694.1 hypothetical protein [Paenibacillus sp. LHD-38]